jgi:carbamoyltransferase
VEEGGHRSERRRSGSLAENTSALIEAFFRLTGVPIVLNTSFNENEPVVCHPEEALDCFLRTKMDVLVLGHHMIRRA